MSRPERSPVRPNIKNLESPKRVSPKADEELSLRKILKFVGMGKKSKRPRRKSKQSRKKSKKIHKPRK